MSHYEQLLELEMQNFYESIMEERAVFIWQWEWARHCCQRRIDILEALNQEPL